MNEIIAFLRQMLGELRLWVVVAPWEEAIRVRCGRWQKHLRSGIHLKLPLIDAVYLQSVRMRISTMPRQTVTTKQGKAVTFTAAIQYAIGDIRKLYNSVHHPEDTIQNLAKARISEVIAMLDHPQPREVEALAGELIREDLKRFGLVEGRVFLNDFAIVRTYRLIGDSSWGSWGSALNTDQAHGAKA